MKLYEIISKYGYFKSEIKEYLSDGGLIVAAILTHAWVMVQCTQKLCETIAGNFAEKSPKE